MKYLGGKARHGADIARVIRSKRRQGQTIREPFCGACWVTQHLYPGPLYCSDIHEPLIRLHQAIQKNWEPPDSIGEQEYDSLHQQWKDGVCSPLIGFTGFACSWGGKWFAGYARHVTRNYCLEAKQSLIEKHKRLKEVTFTRTNYRTISPHNEVIYCDPPYRGTTGFHGEIFDTVAFWKRIRYWSQKNTVIVSEYEAPSDFKIIWSAEHFSIHGTDAKPTTEKLFQLK